MAPMRTILTSLLAASAVVALPARAVDGADSIIAARNDPKTFYHNEVDPMLESSKRSDNAKWTSKVRRVDDDDDDTKALLGGGGSSSSKVRRVDDDDDDTKALLGGGSSSSKVRRGEENAADDIIN